MPGCLHSHYLQRDRDAKSPRRCWGRVLHRVVSVLRFQQQNREAWNHSRKQGKDTLQRHSSRRTGVSLVKRDRVAEIHFYEWRVGAWLSSEAHDRLDATGRGIYRELLDHCYTQGKVPDDPEWMCRRCACTREQLEVTWKIIGKHFPKISGTEYLSNVQADIFRKEYFSYVARQRANRAGYRDRNSNKSSDINNGGGTVVATGINRGRTNGNGNGNGNGNRSADAQWSPEESAVAVWLRDFPGAGRLSGEPDIEIVRRCMDLDSIDRLREAIRQLGIARKSPSRSWAWFPTAIASQLRKKA